MNMVDEPQYRSIFDINPESKYLHLSIDDNQRFQNFELGIDNHNLMTYKIDN